jgi:hypothetical protein
MMRAHDPQPQGASYQAGGLSPVCHRETGQSGGCYRVPLSYLVVYQNSGVAANWVRFPNAFGSVAETFVFEAQSSIRLYPLYAGPGRRPWLSVAETVEEPAEDAALPGEGLAGWRCHGPLACDRLVIVCPGDSVNDLGLVEVLGAVDLRHVANQHAVAHDLGFEARGTVGIPLGVAAGQ